MPNIPGIPDDLQALPGVQANQPPAEVIGPTLNVISNAINAAKLGENEHGKLIWVANRKGERVAVNLAVVNKFGKHFEVVGWIGKEWGEPVSAGVAGAVKW